MNTTAEQSTITLLDGGMGRELKRMGAPFRQPEWSALSLIEAPAYVEQAHQAFVAAGSEVITTNNYAVSPFHLGQVRFDEHGEALTALAGSLARNVADQADSPVQVAGSVPPLYGSYRPDLFDAAAAKQELPKVLASLHPYVDIWLAETVSSLAEFEAIVDALEYLNEVSETGDPKPLWVSFTLKDMWVDNSVRLRSGETVAEALAYVSDSPAEAFLFNCSQPEFISHGIALVMDLTGGAAAVRTGGYANAFTPRSDKPQANVEVAIMREELTPTLYQEAFVASWVDQGASIVGGCCGLGPEHITALANWLKRG